MGSGSCYAVIQISNRGHRRSIEINNDQSGNYNLHQMNHVNWIKSKWINTKSSIKSKERMQKDNALTRVGFEPTPLSRHGSLDQVNLNRAP